MGSAQTSLLTSGKRLIARYPSLKTVLAIQLESMVTISLFQCTAGSVHVLLKRKNRTASNRAQLFIQNFFISTGLISYYFSFTLYFCLYKTRSVFKLKSRIQKPFSVHVVGGILINVKWRLYRYGMDFCRSTATVQD